MNFPTLRIVAVLFLLGTASAEAMESLRGILESVRPAASPAPTAAPAAAPSPEEVAPAPAPAPEPPRPEARAAQDGGPRTAL